MKRGFSVKDDIVWYTALEIVFWRVGEESKQGNNLCHIKYALVAFLIF